MSVTQAKISCIYMERGKLCSVSYCGEGAWGQISRKLKTEQLVNIFFSFAIIIDRIVLNSFIRS